MKNKFLILKPDTQISLRKVSNLLTITDKLLQRYNNKLVEQVDAEAHYNRGVMYDKGQGVEKDYKQAVYWYKMAAEQGHAFAQFSLGFMYTYGRGVEKDYKQAIYWYKMAAEQGHAFAQANLRFMYDNGRGVEQDEKQADFWYSLSATQGDENAIKNRDVIAKKLSTKDLYNAPYGDCPF